MLSQLVVPNWFVLLLTLSCRHYYCQISNDLAENILAYRFVRMPDLVDGQNSTHLLQKVQSTSVEIPHLFGALYLQLSLIDLLLVYIGIKFVL